MELQDIDVNGMRNVMDRIKKRLDKSVILLYNVNKHEEKGVFFMWCYKKHVDAI